MTENPDTPPHLLSINFLSTGKLMKHSTEWLPYGILRHCQTKNFDRKSWYFLPPPTSSHPKIFSIPEIGETLGGSPPKFFGTVRQKIFDGKSWYPPLIHKLFGYRKVDGTQHRKVPLWNSSALSDKIFDRKPWYSLALPTSPPFIHEFFRYLKLVKL